METKKIMIVLICVFLLIGFTLAIKISEFDLGLTAENLTFTLESNDSCYQEFSNVSTTCGGINNGSYTNESEFDVISNIYDGTWGGSPGMYADTVNATLFINYSKPSSVYGAFWEVKDGSPAETKKLTINSDCFNQEILQLKGISAQDNYVYWDCYDGTNWINLRRGGHGDDPYLWEEAIIWDYIGPLNYRNFSIYRYANVTGAFINLTGNENTNYYNPTSGGYGTHQITSPQRLAQRVNITNLILKEIQFNVWCVTTCSGGANLTVRYASNDSLVTYCSLSSLPSYGYINCSITPRLLNGEFYIGFEPNETRALNLDNTNPNVYGEMYKYNGTAWNFFEFSQEYTDFIYNLTFDESPLYPNDINITLNNTSIIQGTREFNQTNNITNDFRTTLNTALNSGVCDCNNCSLTGENCTIPIDFLSRSYGILEYSDINITWEEYTNPNVSIAEPTGLIDSRAIDYNANLSDDYRLQTCYYNVTQGTNIEVSNTTINCTANVNGSFLVSSLDKTYIFHLTAVDESGNMNITNSTFTTYTGGGASPLGGGSAGKVIVEEGGIDLWSVETSTGAGKYEIYRIKGISKTKDLLFENLGEENRIISLSCEDVNGSLCKYVSFSQESFNLPTLKNTKKSVSFTIDFQEQLEEVSETFNVVATDDRGNKGIVTVETIDATFLEVFFSKLLSSKKIGEVRFPYFVMFLFSIIGAGIVSVFALRKVRLRAFLTILISLISGIVIVSVF